MDLRIFLQENKYIDFSSQIIQSKAHELFKNINSNTEKAKIAFEYVRDEIPHSFEIQLLADSEPNPIRVVPASVSCTEK